MAVAGSLFSVAVGLQLNGKMIIYMNLGLFIFISGYPEEGSSETLGAFYQTPQHNIPEDCNLY